MKQVLVSSFCVLYCFTGISQIRGNITNSKQEPLPSVNIYIENTFTGTTSNDEGHYELNISLPKTYTIVFQYLGFKTLKKTVTINSFPLVLDAVLDEEEISLDEVVIHANENPANNIIRQAIAKRKEHLNRIQSYKADFYSRGLIRIKDAPKNILGQEIGDLGGGLDSTRSGVIYLSETISKLEFLRPNKLKEQITASKISGDDNGFSFNTAMDVDYNFYNNTIELGNQIISPIADYAFNYYRYKLEGIFYDDRGNLINKVRVIPKRDKDPIFSGMIYIVENQWTIYALELDITGEQAQILPADVITLKQNFAYSESDAIWALISQRIDFKFGLFGIKGDGRFTAVYSQYEFNPDLDKKDFGREIVSFAEAANQKDSLFWKQTRPVPLTLEEVNDYTKKDSLQVLRKSETYLDSIDRKNNALKLGNLLSGYTFSNSYEHWNTGMSSPISALKFNTVQGWNATIGLHYRKNYDEFRRYLSLNAHINYGFSDDKLRGTLSATYKFNNVSRPFLTLSGGTTVEQFNSSEPISTLLNTAYSLLAEKNYMKLYDKAFAKIAFSNELFNGFRMHTNLSFERRTPLFNTTDQVWYPQNNREYTSNNPLDDTAHGLAPFEVHNILKLNVSASIHFGLHYLSYPDSKINIPNDAYPTLTLGYEKGFAATQSDYNFDQIKGQVTQDFNMGNKGKFQYTIKAGKFFKADDIAFMDYQLFNGNQTHVGSGSYLNVFNNLPYYELSSNTSYLELHAEHNFGGYILGKIPLLNTLNFNLIVGAHTLATPDTKPYQEYTLGIDNIGWGKFRFLRLDYVRSYQSGFINDAFVFGLSF
ncbi:DUF5686 and carboxypeptidase regulatory-like domain-containing protein [Flavobacteriaceae bacterium LMO-SS05]